MSQFGDNRTQAQYTFAAAGALNTEVVGTDLDTGENSFTPRSQNRILDIVHDIDPAAGLTYVLKTRRQERRRVLGRTPTFLTTFTGDKRVGFPIGLGAGFFQLVNIQQAGALTSLDYIVTYQNALSL